MKTRGIQLNTDRRMVLKTWNLTQKKGGNKLYLQTFNEKDNKIEYVIMDIKGNNQKSVFLPQPVDISFDLC